MQVYLTTERKTIEVFNFVGVSPTGRRRYFCIAGTAHLFISPGPEAGDPVKFGWSMSLSVRKITDYQHRHGLDGVGWWYDSFGGSEIDIPTRRQFVVYERRPVRDEELRALSEAGVVA